jgi:outer membrane protein assembly factor BamD
VKRRTAAYALRIAGLAAALAAAGCASTPDEEDVEILQSAEAYYQAGEETLAGQRFLLFFRRVDYPKAIKYFQEVIDNYPYSDHAVLAELRIADTHFSQRDYKEALSYYQDFVELHPNHPKVPYAIYRNGLCSYEQIRGSDRDQAATREAASQFQALLERYPNAEEAEDAKLKLSEVRDHLAHHELEIADFYYEQDLYHAAVQRYQRALDTYPDHTGNLETQARVGFCLARLRRPGEAERVLRGALGRGAQDELRDRIEGELERIASLPSFGPAPLARSCETDPNPACVPTEHPPFVEDAQ